jgi:ATP-dependent RNA helicase DDX1
LVFAVGGRSPRPHSQAIILPNATRITRSFPKPRPKQALYPAVCLKNAEALLNFGAAPFKHGPPPGYTGIASAPPGALARAGADGGGGAAGGGGGGGGGRRPLCLVMEPSRDLAEQTHK